MGTTERWTDEAVILESERWVHVPVASILTENGERFLVHPPSHRGTSRVWRSWPTRGRAVGLILETIEEVRESSGGRLVWHTGDGVSPPFMDDLLSRHGFEKTEDLEVLAFELGDDPRPRLPRLGGRDLRVDLVRDAAGLREAHAIESRVFPHSPELTDPEIRDYLRGVEAPCSRKPEPDYADARTLRFLAFVSDPVNWGERAVATAGAQVVSETVRLWGAGTLAEHRGRGAYRALVVERCRLAHALGATLALTKANTATSAPLLRNAGFRPVASERRHALQIPDKDRFTTSPMDHRQRDTFNHYKP